MTIIQPVSRYGSTVVKSVSPGVPSGSSFVPITATGGTITDIDVAGRAYRVHTFLSSADLIISSLVGGAGAWRSVLRPSDHGRD